MARGAPTSTGEQLAHLEQLTSALGDAVTLDDVARAALSAAMDLPEVIRVGLGICEGAGRQLRFVSTDEGRLSPAAVRWCLIDGYADVPLTQAARHGSDVLVPSLDHLADSFPDILERQRLLGTRSLAALALARDEERLGGLLLTYGDEQEFGGHDRAFLSAFAAQVTQAVRRGLAYHIEHTNSEQLQRSLMPRSLPELPGLALGSFYQPGGPHADVGGDWYDVMELPDGSVAMSLGDVMGKGVPAAIVMSQVRSALRAYAMLDPSPGVVLARLDRLVGSLGSEEQIVTGLYGVIDPGRTSMTYAAAGHPGPLLITGRGRPVLLDGQGGPALGLGAEPAAVSAGHAPDSADSATGSWPQNRVDLTDDATVLFFSNGLVESRYVDLSRGIERLRDQVAGMGTRRRNPREMCARLGESVKREDADDDVTILAAAVTAARDEHSASTQLPPDPTAAGLARRFVTAQLRLWGVDEEVSGVAELCVSELVTNAIIHSGTPSEVTVRVDPTCVLVLVQDRGSRGSVERSPESDPLSVSGRGLTLVEALTAGWNAEHSADGTTVWFELERAAGAR